MLCPHCGQPHAPGATFCPNTGRQLAQGGRRGAWPFAFLAALGLASVGVGGWMLWPPSTEMFGFTAPVMTAVAGLPVPFDANGSTAVVTTTPAGMPSPTGTSAVPPTATLAPSAASRPTASPLPTDTPRAVSEAADTWVSPADGMPLIRIPAGGFVRGTSPERLAAMLALCPTCVAAGLEDQSPERLLYLDEFWIDQTEVTNGQFAQFVAQSGYVTTAEQKRNSYVFNPLTGDFDYLPDADWRRPRSTGSDIAGREQAAVTQMSWDDAAAYCNWVGRRLPTEAEWEKAARGANGLLFPWGNEPPDSTRLNFNLYLRGPEIVGRYPGGASPYGVLDMAGNVWEWTADYFSEDYYAAAPDRNPAGPASGDGRSLRGGSWASRAKGEMTFVTTTYRLWNYSYIRSDVLGFRCATANPAPQGVSAVRTSPPRCALTPSGAFADVWSRFQTELGCPTAERPRAIQDAEQPFQNGHMFWRGDVDVVYVIYDGTGATTGTWVQYPGKYNEGGALQCTAAPPSGLYKPVRGFGNVWCGLGGTSALIGWGLDAERGFGAGQGVVRVQDFERGVIFQDSDGAGRNLVYVLFNDGRFMRTSL